MDSFAFAGLADRAVIAVRGTDARHFLQNLVTANIDAVAPGRAAYGALLTPQGKVQFDFIAFADGDGFLLDTPLDRAEDFAKRLGFYKLRAAVTVALVPDLEVIAAWGDVPTPTGATAAALDPRNADLGFRVIAPAGASPFGGEPVSASDYDAHRIRLGIPAGGIDFAFGDAFPHDIDMDQLGGIDFKKGCYTGQEIVSRMEHRGTARRRIVKVRAAEALPPTGTPILAGEIEIGRLGSTLENTGLAMVRLDRAREALDAGVAVTAAGLSLDLTIPDWARFGWPKAAAE
ncbi:MAG: folate-binding protein YgfZ [Bauldia sp.]